MEELVSQLEIFYATTKPFPEEFPDADTFLWKNSLQPTAYNVFSEEFDYTMCQTYYLFKKMFMFLNTWPVFQKPNYFGKQTTFFFK